MIIPCSTAHQCMILHDLTILNRYSRNTSSCSQARLPHRIYSCTATTLSIRDATIIILICTRKPSEKVRISQSAAAALLMDCWPGEMRCQFHIKWPLFSAIILQNAPVLGENVAKNWSSSVKLAAYQTGSSPAGSILMSHLLYHRPRLTLAHPLCLPRIATMIRHFEIERKPVLSFQGQFSIISAFFQQKIPQKMAFILQFVPHPRRLHNTKSIIFSTKSIIFSTKSIIFNTNFIDFNANRYLHNTSLCSLLAPRLRRGTHIHTKMSTLQSRNPPRRKA